MKIITSILALTSLFITTAVFADLPQIGDTAPAFSGYDQNSNLVNSADIIGKKIVLLYFYPKDFTGGCTKEACGFRDRMGDLQKDNVQVIGVSFDSSATHQEFIAKYNLNFTLLADSDGKIADIYGTRIAGKNLAHRISFLIGLDGKIVHVTNSGNPQVHFDEMKTAIASLQKPM
jgi:thioredoxin-dependent peroxiredoxin